MERKVILVDYEIQEKILHEIEFLKQLLSEKSSKKDDNGIQWMDNKQLMEHLHLSRKTTLLLRQKGLPLSQVSGKLLYRRDLVDIFVSNYRLNLYLISTPIYGKDIVGQFSGSLLPIMTIFLKTA